MWRTVSASGIALLPLLVAVACNPALPATSIIPGGDWTADVVEQHRNVTGAPMVSAFRIAQNAAFDRVVFEFAAGEVPSYRIAYVDPPVRQCGSGNAVELRGDAWLSIRLDPAVAHTPEGSASVENRIGDVDLPVVLEHRLLCDFEGQVEWVLGVLSPNQFRVQELSAPARLVVDVLH